MNRPNSGHTPECLGMFIYRAKPIYVIACLGGNKPPKHGVVLCLKQSRGGVMSSPVSGLYCKLHWQRIRHTLSDLIHCQGEVYSPTAQHQERLSFCRHWRWHFPYAPSSFNITVKIYSVCSVPLLALCIAKFALNLVQTVCLLLCISIFFNDSNCKLSCLCRSMFYHQI